MTRVAPHVHIDNAEIAQLEALALRLPQDQRVQVRLDDGRELTGIVSQTPTIQTFYDPDGQEGLNAIVRIEAFLDDGRPHEGGEHYIWLDHIEDVMPLPNPSPPESSTRVAPPDPNAPTPEQSRRER